MPRKSRAQVDQRDVAAAAAVEGVAAAPVAEAEPAGPPAESPTPPERPAEDEPEIVDLPVVALHDTVVFPNMLLPLRVGRAKSLKAIEAALAGDREVALIAEREPIEDVKPSDLFTVGTIGAIAQALRLQDGTVQILVQGQRRAQVAQFLQEEPHLAARLHPIDEPAVEKTVEVEALMRNVQALIERYVELAKNVPEGAIQATRSIETPNWLADVTAYSPEMTFSFKQELLETFDPLERLRKVSLYLTKQLEIMELKDKIQSEVQKGVEKNQREFFLREQLRAITRELNESSPEQAIATELREKIEAAGMPEEVKVRAIKELDRLQMIPSASPEVGVIRTYLDWLIALPWSRRTDDNTDLKHAAAVLDEDHYGLRKVKERILEYIAVRRLAPRTRSPILCLVGPPGVGKTSLGRSIARALGRQFVRMSLGGVHDEAEIRGHRRTYVGALPGRIVQGMKNAGSKNPIFILDEVDKIGRDFRGDPSSALLEVLDPEQNSTFSDHYLEVPFDLSEVIFVTTANLLDPIPPPLRDRMEVIEIPGYTEDEKLQIARRHLMPKQLEAHGLTSDTLVLSTGVLQGIIQGYTREAGVRNLEREIANICRKAARRIAEGRRTVRVRRGDLASFLGPVRFEHEAAEEADAVGVATGVSWTSVGGEVLTVEVTIMDGGDKENPILTGQLGDVMRESARAALSYARSRHDKLGVPAKFFETHTIHIHVPAGAIPKDGPSAGITMTTALVSALTGRPVRRDVAMTGEVTLRGRVLPIGGLKEKMLAAHRAGIKTFILPAKNTKDLVEVAPQVLKSLRVVPVEHVDAVLDEALVPKS